MIRKLLSLLIIGLFVCTGVNAQRCATDIWVDQTRKEEPDRYARMLEIQNETKSWIANKSRAYKSEATFTIPVVVHVLYHKDHPEQNIPDAQIHSQIDVLNEDYNRNNPDASQTPSYFLPIAGSIDVEFCLATLDPNGKPTTGIVRKEVPYTSFNVINSTERKRVYYSALGGSDAWPNTEYLNVWVVAISGTQLGGAPKPGQAPAAEDGFLVAYDVFGRGFATLRPGFNRGRTATHEIGHWLGLDHTFYQPGTCADDGVADTPLQLNPSSGCPTGKRTSCSGQTNGDNYQNYLDYTSDPCMNMFTKGQVQLMTGTLNTIRASLKSSQGCNGTPSADIGVLSLNRPRSSVDCSSPIQPLIKMKNYGATTIKNVNIKFHVDNNAPQTYKWQGNLIGGAITNVVMDPITIPSGNHTFTVYTESPNGIQDSDPANDKQTESYSCVIDGMEEIETQSVYLYPNPTTGKFLISAGNYAIDQIQVIDILGNIVQRFTGKEKMLTNIEIDLSDKENGIYFISIWSQNINIKERIILSK